MMGRCCPANNRPSARRFADGLETPEQSEFRYADVPLAFFSKSHKEENRKTDQRYEKKDTAKHKVLFLSIHFGRVHVLVNVPSASAQADHPYHQKQILHGCSLS